MVVSSWVLASLPAPRGDPHYRASAGELSYSPWRPLGATLPQQPSSSLRWGNSTPPIVMALGAPALFSRERTVGAFQVGWYYSQAHLLRFWGEGCGGNPSWQSKEGFPPRFSRFCCLAWPFLLFGFSAFLGASGSGVTDSSPGRWYELLVVRGTGCSPAMKPAYWSQCGGRVL